MIVNPQINLGDVVVALTTIGSIWVAYTAMKGEIASFRSDLNAFRSTATDQAKTLQTLASKIISLRTKIATLEGHVFGRRTTDVDIMKPDAHHSGS